MAARLEAFATESPAGTRLPSVRQLMADHRIGPNTVQRVIAALQARGLVEARPGRGTFVAPRAAPSEPADMAWQTVALGPATVRAEFLLDLLRPPAPGTYVLSSGYLPLELQPQAALARAVSRAARRPGAWDRMPIEGLAELRAWFAAEAGGGVSAADVLVCGGGQAALSTILRALARPGEPVVVDSPTYPGLLIAARAIGLEIVPVPADRDGVRPDLLADALERTGARLACLQPVFANPHGGTLAADRRAAVLEAARAAGAFLLEDDAFRDLAIDGPAPPPLLHDDRDGHVVHLRGLTKPGAAGLRVAAIVARGPVAARLRAARMVQEYFVPGVLQQATLDVVTAPAWPRHLQRVRTALRERRDALLGALAAHGLAVPAPPRGGSHAWVALAAGADETAVVAAAAADGVLVSAGGPYFASEPPGPFLRVTYAAEPPDRLAEGVARLSRAAAPS